MRLANSAERLAWNGAIDKARGCAGHPGKQVIEQAKVRICVPVCRTEAREGIWLLGSDVRCAIGTERIGGIGVKRRFGRASKAIGLEEISRSAWFSRHSSP